MSNTLDTYIVKQVLTFTKSKPTSENDKKGYKFTKPYILIEPHCKENSDGYRNSYSVRAGVLKWISQIKH